MSSISTAAPVPVAPQPEPRIGWLELLRTPGLPGPALFRVLGGLAVGVNQLALVLLVRERTGSFATAGAVVGLAALAGALTAPPLGRALDRFGHARVLVPCAFVASAAWIGVLAVGDAVVPLAALAMLAGVAAPPVTPAARELLPRLAGPGGRDAAFALEAVLLEVFFIGGPLLAAVIIAIASPAAAIAVSAGLTFAGGAGFAATAASRAWRPETVASTGGLGALRSRGMLVMIAWGAPFGATFGVMEVAMPAFGAERGSPESGGILLAALAVGSLVGGLVWGPRAAGGRPARRLVVLCVVLAAGYAAFPVAETIVALCVISAVASLPLAPVSAISFALVEGSAPAGTRQEAHTWLLTSEVTGVALGATVAGALVEASGASAALGAGACALAAAALVALFGARVLSAASTPVPSRA